MFPCVSASCHAGWTEGALEHGPEHLIQSWSWTISPREPGGDWKCLGKV